MSPFRFVCLRVCCFLFLLSFCWTFRRRCCVVVRRSSFVVRRSSFVDRRSSVCRRRRRRRRRRVGGSRRRAVMLVCCILSLSLSLSLVVCVCVCVFVRAARELFAVRRTTTTAGRQKGRDGVPSPSVLTLLWTLQLSMGGDWMVGRALPLAVFSASPRSCIIAGRDLWWLQQETGVLGSHTVSQLHLRCTSAQCQEMAKHDRHKLIVDNFGGI